MDRGEPLLPDKPIRRDAGMAGPAGDRPPELTTEPAHHSTGGGTQNSRRGLTTETEVERASGGP